MTFRLHQDLAIINANFVLGGSEGKASTAGNGGGGLMPLGFVLLSKIFPLQIIPVLLGGIGGGGSVTSHLEPNS